MDCLADIILLTLQNKHVLDFVSVNHPSLFTIIANSIEFYQRQVGKKTKLRPNEHLWGNCWLDHV